MVGTLVDEFKRLDEDWRSDYFDSEYAGLSQDRVEELYRLEIEALCDLVKELNAEDGFSVGVRRREVASDEFSGIVKHHDFEIVASRKDGNSEYHAVIPVCIKMMLVKGKESFDDEMGLGLGDHELSSFLERYKHEVRDDSSPSGSDEEEFIVPYTEMPFSHHDFLTLTLPAVGVVGVKDLFVSNIAFALVDAKLSYEYKINTNDAFEQNGVVLLDDASL